MKITLPLIRLLTEIPVVTNWILMLCLGSVQSVFRGISLLISLQRHTRGVIKGCALIVLAFCGVAHADEVDRTEQIRMVYNHSGLEQHLANVLRTVSAESSIAWQDCASTKTTVAIKQELETLLSIDALRAAYQQQLNDRLTDDQLTQIIAFIQSELGKRIYQAELDSANLNDDLIQTLQAELKQDGLLGQERANIVNQMIVDTGAVYFLSALNTELSTLVIMASVCSNSERDIEQAEFQIREERGAEALYRSFLHNQLLLPALIVYRDITSSELAAVSTFAKSESGNAYYAGLIQSLRTVLNVKVGELNKMIRELPQED